MPENKRCWCGGEVQPRYTQTGASPAPVLTGVCIASPAHEWANVAPRDPAHRLYIAGPMTGYPDCNYPAFYTAAGDLINRGYLTVNPADSGNAASYRDILRKDIQRFLVCDGVAVLPGWEKSTGARAEVTLALALQMDIRPVDDWPVWSELGPRPVVMPRKFTESVVPVGAAPFDQERGA